MHPDIASATRFFPLIGRPRPLCTDLPSRLQEVLDAVAAAGQKDAGGMHDAAHALNKAALIASDARRADLAHHLCWQHIDAYRDLGRPLTYKECRYLLEPVHNLARLQIRADRGTSALQLLEAMHLALTRGHPLTVDGQTLPTGDLVGDDRSRQSVRRWVWLQLVADGVRTLALADRWADAAAHAHRYKGVGDHLLEGRQAEIIAHLAHDEVTEAATRLAETDCTKPWENEVAICLHAMCAVSNGDHQSGRLHLENAMDHLTGSPYGPQHGSYRARLGLTVATLAHSIWPEQTAKIALQVGNNAIESGDGYAARDLLDREQIHRHIPDRLHTQLDAAANAAGLDRGAVPEPILQQLTQTGAEAAALLSAALRAQPSP